MTQWTQNSDVTGKEKWRGRRTNEGRKQRRTQMHDKNVKTDSLEHEKNQLTLDDVVMGSGLWLEKGASRIYLYLHEFINHGKNDAFFHEN